MKAEEYKKGWEEEERQQERERRRRESEAWQELQDKEKCQITARAKNRTDWACVSNQWSQEHTHTMKTNRHTDVTDLRQKCTKVPASNKL